MCLIFVSYQQNRLYPLIVAANRDEFYARPSEAVHQWQEDQRIVAGKDTEKGGTWLGVSLDGRFAAVTNYRSGESKEDRKSRGKLVLNLLKSEQPAALIDNELAAHANQYNDFNCLFYFQHQLYYLSNKNQNLINRLSPGTYGLSNGFLDTPWPKLTEGKAEFTDAAEGPADDQAFWDLLNNNQPAADQELPNTGVPLAWEKLLSSRFIQSDDYGTRSSSLLFWSVKGEVEFKERRYDARGFIGQKDLTLYVGATRQNQSVSL